MDAEAFLSRLPPVVWSALVVLSRAKQLGIRKRKEQGRTEDHLVLLLLLLLVILRGRSIRQGGGSSGVWSKVEKSRELKKEGGVLQGRDRAIVSREAELGWSSLCYKEMPRCCPPSQSLTSNTHARTHTQRHTVTHTLARSRTSDNNSSSQVKHSFIHSFLLSLSL